MSTASTTYHEPTFDWGIAWLPLVLLPTTTIVIGTHMAPWVFMWALAFSLYTGFKWLSLVDFTCRVGKPPLGRAVGFVLLWPGMDADAFFDTRTKVTRPIARQWAFALSKIIAGLFVVFFAAPRFIDWSPLLGGWVGMIGIAFFLHFGVLHLLALVWRTAGVNATPIMNAPILAQSLSEFWGKRWNLAFRDLVHRFVFRPVFGRLGVAGATMAVFLVSGLIHEFVISLSSGAAYGLPTLYFLIQGVGVLSTRSRLGKRWGLGKGLAGRASVVLIMVAPLGLLFPPPFVLRVVVPMLQTLAV